MRNLHVIRVLCSWDAAPSQMCVLNRDEDHCVSHKRAERPISRPFYPKAHAMPSPSFCQSGPAARWHPSPWRQLIASPDGNCAARATTSPSFHLLTPAIATAAFSFVLSAPALSSTGLLSCPPSRPSFSSKPPKKCKGSGRGDPDRSCLLHGAGIGTRASEHSDITVAFPLTSIQI